MNDERPLNIVFMGTPEFAVPCLKALAGSGNTVSLVVTAPDRPRDRGHKLSPTPVGEAARSLGIAVIAPDQIRDNEGFIKELAGAAPDLIVVAAYGKILPKKILGIPPLGCVNLHASLLPKYRGAAPVHRAIEAGETFTGVSLMYMSEGLDEGDVAASASIRIDGMNSGQLTEALAEMGAKLLLDNIRGIAQGTLHRVPQDHSSSTYAPPVRREEGHIDFARDTAEVLRKIRAMNPSPGAYCYLGDDRMGIIEASESCANGSGSAVGEIVCVSGQGITVKTGGGGSILIEVIRMPGKRPMAVADYLRGNKIVTGTVLT